MVANSYTDIFKHLNGQPLYKDITNALTDLYLKQIRQSNDSKLRQQTRHKLQKLCQYWMPQSQLDFVTDKGESENKQDGDEQIQHDNFQEDANEQDTDKEQTDNTQLSNTPDLSGFDNEQLKQFQKTIEAIIAYQQWINYQFYKLNNNMDVGYSISNLLSSARSLNANFERVMKSFGEFLDNSPRPQSNKQQQALRQTQEKQQQASLNATALADHIKAYGLDPEQDQEPQANKPAQGPRP